jgi:hypothetical protein
MNRSPGQFHSLLRPAPTLSGGRAERCWRRDGLRQSEKLRAVVTGSDWVNELVYVDLSLSDQPLLGYTLAALMARDGTGNVLQEDESPSQSRFNHVVATGARELLKSETSRDVYRASPLDQSPHARQVARTTKVLNAAQSGLQTQRQVSASMLQRLAGPAGDSFRLNPNDSQRGKNQHLAFSATEAGTRSLSVERLAAVDRANADEPSAFIKRAARRAEIVWRKQSKQFASHGAFLQSAEETQPSSSPDFVEHWSIPVTGSAAPQVLLTRLGNSDKLPAASSSGQMERQLSGSALTGRPRRPTSTETLPVNDSSSARPPFSNSLAKPTAMAAAVNETTAGDDASNRTRSEIFSSSLADESSPRFETHARSDRLAAPALAPSLPPLPPPRSNAETPLPVAAANAQRDAKRDEAFARGEDLNVLAAQIDRILKQEARRHGIDV